MAAVTSYLQWWSISLCFPLKTKHPRMPFIHLGSGRVGRLAYFAFCRPNLTNDLTGRLASAP